jgi:2-hydroxychromene-2-carboxylate isomerase
VTAFALTWDYRCPFARIGHDHVLAGLAAGADWDVSFRAFSLDQTHVEEGGRPVWEEPDRYPATTALLAGIVVRDRLPDLFLAAHGALFAARHEEAADLRDPAVIGRVLDRVGADGAGVLAEVKAGWALDVLQREHSEAVERWQVFGVPTWIVEDCAVFVRLMGRPSTPEAAISTVERIVGMIGGWPELNEYKHTQLAS